MAEREPASGEEALIAEFFAPLAVEFPGAFGLLDDCAVIASPPGHELVLKTDAIAEGVHFIGDEAPEDIGWKALAVNVSDLVAKGATPVAYLMSLSFPAPPSRGWMAAFAKGLAKAQREFCMHLAGGDTDRRPGPVSITIAAFGTVPHGRMVRRGTAKPGDVLVVSGTLGDAAVGLAVACKRDDPDFLALDEEDRRYLLRCYRAPVPAIWLREPLLEHARAAMDISDGLMKDLGRMVKASGVGAIVRAADIPLSVPLRKLVGADAAKWWPAILAGGDDYRVLAAIPPDHVTMFSESAHKRGKPVTVIGEITVGEGVTILAPDGSALALPRAGWDHFA